MSDWHVFRRELVLDAVTGRYMKQNKHIAKKVVDRLTEVRLYCLTELFSK